MGEVIKMPISTGQPLYGKSPAQSMLEAMRASDRMMVWAEGPEAHQLMLCASYWESRRVRGLMAWFFYAHNLHCHLRAEFYRNKFHETLKQLGAK